MKYPTPGSFVFHHQPVCGAIAVVGDLTDTLSIGKRVIGMVVDPPENRLSVRVIVPCVELENVPLTLILVGPVLVLPGPVAFKV